MVRIIWRLTRFRWSKMAEIFGSFILLTPEEMELFLERMNHPDSADLKKRDEFLRQLNTTPIRELPDGSYEFDFDFDDTVAL